MLGRQTSKVAFFRSNNRCNPRFRLIGNANWEYILEGNDLHAYGGVAGTWKLLVLPSIGFDDGTFKQNFTNTSFPAS